MSFVQRRAGISCPELHSRSPSPPPITWQVNDVPFQNLTREEAVQVLLGLPLGEEVELVTQRKQDSEWGGGWGVGRGGAWPAARPTPWGREGLGSIPTGSEPLPVHSLPEDGAIPCGRLLLRPHAL